WRPKVRVPTKIHRVTASTAHWPMNAPEQPAMAMGAMATRYQGVSFIRESPRGEVVDALRCSDLHVCEVTTSGSQEPNFYRRAALDRNPKSTTLLRRTHSKCAHVGVRKPWRKGFPRAKRFVRERSHL